MTSTSSQQKNDCAIVAIANATGMSYDDVAKLLPSPTKKGIAHNDWTTLIQSLGWVKRTNIPRRGQDRITGIVRMISNKRATGHLVYMKDGIVFDSFAPNGMPIKEYQLRTTRKHIQMIWIKVDVLIDTPVKATNDDTTQDFLNSLADLSCIKP